MRKRNDVIYFTNIDYNQKHVLGTFIKVLLLCKDGLKQQRLGKQGEIFKAAIEEFSWPILISKRLKLDEQPGI